MSRDRKVFALIGLDGSGKSANITQFKSDSRFENVDFVWVRWEPTLLAPAYKLMEKKISKSNITQNKEERSRLDEGYNAKSGLKEKIFKNPIVRTIWMSLALLDYKIQFKKKTKHVFSENRDIVFDRFYLDLFVDQGINFGYKPSKIAEEILKYEKQFPTVDAYIYIKVSPETCYKRKNDIPNMDYLNKRYDIYEQLAKGERWITVDGEQDFETVNDNIRKIILN